MKNSDTVLILKKIIKQFLKDLDPKEYKVELMPFYIPTSEEDTTLVFESRFECGNLRRVIQMFSFFIFIN